jgi:hypothetical protein
MREFIHASLETRYDPAGHPLATRFLSDRTGTASAEAGGPVGSELPRIKMGAKVGAYWAVLTESNTRAMLRRKVRLSARVPRA